MKVELALIISIVSVAFGIYQGTHNINRNKVADGKAAATEMTTLIVKLESISSGISELKADIRNMRDEVAELRERLGSVEASTKSAHKRLDTIEQTRSDR